MLTKSPKILDSTKTNILELKFLHSDGKMQ